MKPRSVLHRVALPFHVDENATRAGDARQPVVLDPAARICAASVELPAFAAKNSPVRFFTYHRNAGASLTVSDVLGDLDRDEVGEHSHG
jgi:hypothetical protein